MNRAQQLERLGELIHDAAEHTARGCDPGAIISLTAAVRLIAVILADQTDSKGVSQADTAELQI